MKYEKFYDVCKELESQNKTFDEESIRRLSYGTLMMAFIGNAGKAIFKGGGHFDDLEIEAQRRLDAISQYSIEELNADKGVWDIVDDYSMLYAAMSAKTGEPFTSETAPKWRLLVHYMQKLRGNWSYYRDSPYLEKIYELIQPTIDEGVVPTQWVLAVKENADEFDGHMTDGRIMRDGSRGGMSGYIAGYLGLHPEEKDGGYLGSYEELFEKILTPEQMIQYQTPIEDLQDDY